jgi:D-alanyl-D-alanine carboxypeptidase/D-alanyl-D-alanine-endopeptidase (penicillin-binding protein 4)
MAGREGWSWATRVLVAVLVVGLVVVPAIGLWWVASSAADEAAKGEPTPGGTTTPGPAVGSPILSARRIPGIVTGQLTTASLLAGVTGVGAAVPAPGCLLVTLDDTPLYELRSDEPVIPASNQKLVTGAVALEVLGPDQRFATVVVAPEVSGGVVTGDLTLVGGGDPLLATQPYLDWLAKAAKEVPQPHTSFEALADAIVAAGVTSISGSVVGDESRYDAVRRVPTWPDGYRPSLEGGPLSALLVNDGFTSFVPVASAADPAQHAAAVLTELLQARGVSVGGAPRSGAVPAGATEVARIESVPMAEVVGELLTTSDNNTGELLLKEVGLARGGVGSTAAGAEVVRQTLAGWGVPTAGVVVADGSGLDRGNRATCRELVAVLEQGGAVVRAGLAVAGETGTLSDAFTNNPVRGKLRGKTGTLTGVKSLAGFLDVPDHELGFALVLNVANADSAARPLWEQLGTAFATYPDPLALDQFVPKPPIAAAPSPPASAPTTTTGTPTTRASTTGTPTTATATTGTP